ncbi:MAG: sugar phosphate isomerase/epimerase [Rhodoferax sp.]|nr:sugar phosphate isomerase/epimerase [Rhodoferax sp.]
MPDIRNHSLYAVNTYSYTLRETAPDCVRKLAAQGFREFELMMYPGHLWPQHMDGAARASFRDYLRGEGLSIRTINMPNVDLNIAAATVEMREMTLGQLRRFIALAGDLGAGGIVLGPGKANPLLPMATSAMTDYFHAALRELVPLAQQCGTSVLIENMPFAFLPRIEELLAAMDQFGDQGIGVVYDLANGHFIREDIAMAIRRIGSRLKVLHVSDTSHAVYRHDAVGLGTVDFSVVPAALREIGFSGRPVLEIIDLDPDVSIPRSVQSLCAMGWGAA